jgi:hypothetical protein
LDVEFFYGHSTVATVSSASSTVVLPA